MQAETFRFRTSADQNFVVAVILRHCLLPRRARIAVRAACCDRCRNVIDRALPAQFNSHRPARTEKWFPFRRREEQIPRPRLRRAVLFRIRVVTSLQRMQSKSGKAAPGQLDASAYACVLSSWC
jgi:hypothetical protein